MAMGKDGEIPTSLAYINPRFHTPWVALIFLGVMGVVGSYFTELIVLFDTAASAVLFCYILVVISLLVLRRKEPDLERPYKTWGYPVIPVLAIISIIPAWLISMALLKPWAIGVYFGWMILGAGYFIVFRRKT